MISVEEIAPKEDMPEEETNRELGEAPAAPAVLAAPEESEPTEKNFHNLNQRCKISRRNPKKNADDPRQLPKRNQPRNPREDHAKSRSRR